MTTTIEDAAAAEWADVARATGDADGGNSQAGVGVALGPPAVRVVVMHAAGWAHPESREWSPLGAVLALEYAHAWNAVLGGDGIVEDSPEARELAAETRRRLEAEAAQSWPLPAAGGWTTRALSPPRFRSAGWQRPGDAVPEGPEMTLAPSVEALVRAARFGNAASESGDPLARSDVGAWVTAARDALDLLDARRAWCGAYRSLTPPVPVTAGQKLPPLTARELALGMSPLQAGCGGISS